MGNAGGSSGGLKNAGASRTSTRIDGRGECSQVITLEKFAPVTRTNRPTPVPYFFFGLMNSIGFFGSAGSRNESITVLSSLKSTGFVT